MSETSHDSPKNTLFQNILNYAMRIVVGIVFVFTLGWYFATSYIFINQIRQMSGETMGGITYYVKSFTGATNRTWEKATQKVDDELRRIDGLMSTYKKDSEVTRFNHSESTEWFPVSPDIVQVVKLSKEVSESTDGMFDITVGPLVDLWGFGPKQPKPTQPPTEEQINETKEFCGFDKLEFRMDPPALRKTIPQLQIDLSAVAKGYAVDQVGTVLESCGIKSYMVEIGGETKTKGTKKGGKPWVIGIQEPRISEKTALAPLICEMVNLHDNAMATSGDYFNSKEFGGKRYSHIIDPKTGRPTEAAFDEQDSEESLGSVSVIAPTCAEADALATGLFVLGVEKGLALANEKNIPVLYLVRTSNAEEPFRKITSKSFEQGKWVVK